MSDLTIFVNTHSSCADLWPMFFGQLHRYWHKHPPVVMAVDDATAGSLCCSDRTASLRTIVNYSPAKRFTSQYLMGLCAVETPYVLTLQEDMILYGDVDESCIRDAISKLRIVGNPGNFQVVDSVRLIHSGPSLSYSMQATVWLTHCLKMLYADCDCDTPWEAEQVVGGTFRSYRKTLVVPPSGRKRGNDHYDNPKFPYIATALVKGKWNAEYRAELEPLHAEYGIDASKRGWTE